VAEAPVTKPEMAAPPAESVPAMPHADPTRAAEAAPALAGDAHPETAPAPSALQLAALVEPAPGLPTPVDRTAPPAMPAAAVPADQADRERAPTPPPAASDARVTTPLPMTAAPASTAKYRVQLALLRDEENVKYVWRDFVAQFGPSAKDFHRYVFPIRTAHGIRQLVQVGPFEDQDHAEAMCAKLKQRGGDCFVVRQPS
jgi:cell division septation protein DedD